MLSSMQLYLCLTFIASAYGLNVTEERCSTRYGATSPSAVPSTTFEQTTTLTTTLRSTTTPIDTITPKPTTKDVTITDTVIVTIASTTDTITETTTVETLITKTGTTTFTYFDTITITSTEATPVSTVPTSPGFTYPNPPPSPTFAQQKRAARYLSPSAHQLRRLAVEERASLDADAVQRVQLDIAHGTLKHSPDQYPTSVLCTETIRAYSTLIITKTAHPKTTTAATPTVTSTITITSTSTSSIFESFTAITSTTTITGTLLTDITSTTTQVTTETATLIPPTETVYAACNAKNIIVPPSGYYFASESYSPPSIQTNVQLPHNTSYDCCVACITDPYCKVAEFFLDATYSEVSCHLDYGSSNTSCNAETVNVSIGNGGEEFMQSLSRGNCPNGNFAFTYQGY